MRVPQGEFELERCPADSQLQAWDAADELLLEHLSQLDQLTPQSSVLILNDAFGALSVALADSATFFWNDSFLSHKALTRNLQLNGYDPGQISTNSTIRFPEQGFDFVFLKVPKTAALLEHQLYAIRPLLHGDSLVIAAGMSRHIHTKTLNLFESLLGPSSTTRAVKKARLILVERDHSINTGQSPYPDSYELEVDRVYRLHNHASLFSREHLDAGTRKLIENIPLETQYERIVDLACGNGVVGLVAALSHSAAKLTFCDESYMAVESARLNFEAAFHQQRIAEFYVCDCLEKLNGNSSDLILLNPPFHQSHVVSDNVAWQMFKQSRQVLQQGGALRIVANRHLAHHTRLKKLFGNCQTVDADKRFVVLNAIKR